LLGRALERARRIRKAIDDLPGLHVLEKELISKQASHDLDILHVLIDVSGLGITGFQASDWTREKHALDLGLSDHRRVEATLSMADDDAALDRLVEVLGDLAEAAAGMPSPPEISMPSFNDLEIEPVMLPRDAFFGPVEDVPVEHAAGRVAAEQITPYPPGIPAVVPGERINEGVLEYLRSGLEAGMVLPDPADLELNTVRVVGLP
jgi:arginine/lysine/ornithine decarboxylase